MNIPGCATPGRLFVGQRKDPFAVNLGVIFDLVDAPLGVITNPSLVNACTDDLADKNVTALAIEVAAACLVASPAQPVIGGWTSAGLRQGQYLTPSPARGHGTTVIPGGDWTQVSRLGMPLVNEVVIGLPDKDRFNSSSPKDDSQFADYVMHPTLPGLIEVAFGQARSRGRSTACSSTASASCPKASAAACRSACPASAERSASSPPA